MDPLIIPVVGILMPVVLVPTIIFMKHRHHRREWEHQERMRSLEMSGPIPSAQPLEGLAGVAAIGAGVPIASVITAFLTCIVVDVSADDQIPMAGIAWGCALMISVGAMATGLILAFMQARAKRESEASAFQVGKQSVYDPDAFDVVSSRG